MLRTFPYQGLVVPRPPRTVLNPPSHYSPSVLPHISLQEGCSASSMPSLASKLTVLEMAKSPRPKDPALVVEWKDACPESNLPGWRLMLTVQSSLWVGDSWNELLPPGPHSVC